MTIRKLFLYIFVVALIDQITKYAVESVIVPLNPITIIPKFFNLVLTYNKGVAFGFMSEWSEAFRIVIISITSVIAVGILIWMYFSTYKSSETHCLAIAMILGGALGNIIDRIRVGAVVDFLDFYIATWHWPAFNVADSCICIGVFILIMVKE